MLIALATDKNYVELAGVLIRSIVASGEVPEAQIVVCADGLDSTDRSNLTECAGRLAVRFFDLDTARPRLADAKRTDNWPLTTWARVVLPDMVTETHGRMLYLDTDIVVAKSLRPLIDVDMKGFAVACVPVDKGQAFVDETNIRLERSAGAAYFNAGVMLVDISEWRRGDVTNAALQVARHFGDRLTYLDQDALNTVFDGKFCALDRRWNWYSLTGDHTTASIIHFVYEKPHISGSKHPAKNLYYAHRAKTPWASGPLVSPWIKRRKKWLRKVRALVGLR